MAIPQVKAVDTKVHTFDFNRVSEWARAKVPGYALAEQSGGGGVRAFQFTHGQSNPTFLLAVGTGAAERKYVLRKKPAGKLLPSAHLIEREYRVMAALAGSKVPVPRVYAYCDDPKLIGTEFYVMAYVEGRIFKDIALPGMPESARFAIYADMNRVLSELHTVDVKASGLSDYGKTTDYVARTVDRWAKQYEGAKTGEIKEMNDLSAFLRENLPATDPDLSRVSLVHGDFRLDNLIFHPTQLRVVAVLDWELSTLGHPTVDLAHNCMVYHFDAKDKRYPGLLGVDFRRTGIPSESEYVSAYERNSRRTAPVSSYAYYLAVSCFRMASIAQGVYRRSQLGNASNASAGTFGVMVPFLAARGLELARKKLPEFKENLAEVKMALAPAQYSKDFYALRKRLVDFMNEHIYPNASKFEHDYELMAKAAGTRWCGFPPLMDQLKAKAREAGLWNLFLSKRAVASVKIANHTFPGLTNLEYAPLCEVMGRVVHFAPEVFNCSAPDTGNMETIALYGTKEQQETWLRPLMDGKIRSCFGMTEPAVASSDATNIESLIERDGDEYVINGRKWWTSGAMDPRCKICVFMGKTNPKAPVHLQQSMVLVPMDTPGVQILRPLDVYGFDDAPHGHAEVRFTNVRVPVTNILLGEGRGFEIAQGRLGPGRIHHCMRLIGMAETALEAMVRRAQTRTTFGTQTSKKGAILHDIAESRIEIEQCRLLTLQAAALMDTVGSKAAKQSIAMIKVAAPNMACRVFDRAIQAHGGLGVHSDLPLARLWTGARALRLADGPDEVHRETVAKEEILRSKL